MQWTSGISTSYPVCAVPSAVDMRASLPLKVEKLINIMAVEQVPFGKGIMIIYTWRTRHHRTEMFLFIRQTKEGNVEDTEDEDDDVDNADNHV